MNLDAIRSRWPRIDEGSARLVGDSPTELAALVERTYGMPLEQADREVREWLGGREQRALTDAERERLEGEDAGRGDPRLGESEPTVG